MAILRVMPENVTPLWDQFETLFIPALEMVRTHSPEDVRRQIMSMRVQLWAQMEGSEVEAAATTEFVDYPVGLYLRVWHAGATRTAQMDCDGFFSVLDHWRKANGAIGFECIGRHGWLRKLPGARVEGLVMRMVP